MPVVTCIDDLRSMAKKRVARAVFEYVDYGSYDQVRVESAVSGPFSDSVSGRLAVLYQKFDPIIDNDYPNRFVTL